MAYVWLQKTCRKCTLKNNEALLLTKTSILTPCNRNFPSSYVPTTLCNASLVASLHNARYEILYKMIWKLYYLIRWTMIRQFWLADLKEIRVNPKIDFYNMSNLDLVNLCLFSQSGEKAQIWGGRWGIIPLFDPTPFYWKCFVTHPHNRLALPPPSSFAHDKMPDIWVGHSVTRLGYFWKIAATKFHT